MDRVVSLIFSTAIVFAFHVTFFYPIFSFAEIGSFSENYYPIKFSMVLQMNDDILKIIPSDLNYDSVEIVELQIEPKEAIQRMSEYILNMKLTYNTADTIKRILLGYLNSANLILNDNDSDNDDLICSNIIPKLLSDVELYEEINFLKADQANKIYVQIDVLKNSSCNSK